MMSMRSIIIVVRWVASLFLVTSCSVCVTSHAQTRETVFNVKKRNHLQSVYFPRDSVVFGPCYCGGKAGNTFKSWSLVNGGVDTLFSLDQRTWIDVMAMGHNGDLIAIATMGDEPHFLGCYSLSGHAWQWKFDNAESVRDLTFSEDDQEVIAVWSDWIYRIDSRSGKRLERYAGILRDFPLGGNKITLGSFSTSGRYYAIWQEHPSPWGLADLGLTAANKEVCVWDLRQRKTVANIKKPDAIVLAVTFSDSEDYLFMSCADHKILLASLAENKIVTTCDGDANYLTSCKGRKFVAGGSWEATVWEYPTMNKVKNLGTLTNAMRPSEEMPLAFSNDGRWLAIEQLGRLNLYDTDSWEVRWSVQTCP